MNEERDAKIRAEHGTAKVADQMEKFNVSRARYYQIINPEAAAGQVERKNAKLKAARK